MSPAKNFSAISSRSRGLSDASALTDRHAPQADARRSSSTGTASLRRRLASSGAVRLRGAARRAPRCARSRTATPARDPRARPEAPALAIGALERERGDVLGSEAVAQQRRDVRVHVVAARAIQMLELDVGRRAGRHREHLVHTLTTTGGRSHHNEIYRQPAAPRHRRAGGAWEGLVGGRLSRPLRAPARPARRRWRPQASWRACSASACRLAGSGFGAPARSRPSAA